MLPPLANGGTLLATVWTSVPHSYASFWLRAPLPSVFTDEFYFLKNRKIVSLHNVFHFQIKELQHKELLTIEKLLE
jgi:hypothetical protein